MLLPITDRTRKNAQFLVCCPLKTNQAVMDFGRWMKHGDVRICMGCGINSKIAINRSEHTERFRYYPDDLKPRPYFGSLTIIGVICNCPKIAMYYDPVLVRRMYYGRSRNYDGKCMDVVKN